MKKPGGRSEGTHQMATITPLHFFDSVFQLLSSQNTFLAQAGQILEERTNGEAF